MSACGVGVWREEKGREGSGQEKSALTLTLTRIGQREDALLV